MRLAGPFARGPSSSSCWSPPCALILLCMMLAALASLFDAIESATAPIAASPTEDVPSVSSPRITISLNSAMTSISSPRGNGDSPKRSDAQSIPPARQANLSVACVGRSSRRTPLPGTFTFFGKPSNSSSTCPTSGMNNQLTLVLALTECAAARRLRVFRWKDISCTPTGGKEAPCGASSRRRYAVGGADYDYAWFRWSDIFEVASPSAAVPVTLCLRDEHSWSEHTELKGCPVSPPPYGSSRYWSIRSTMMLRPQFGALAECFLRAAVHPDTAPFWAAIAAREMDSVNRTSSSVSCDRPRVSSQTDDEGTATWKNALSAMSAFWRSCGGNVSREERDRTGGTPFVGAHIRRGDYENFCEGIVGNSGASKFRVPPYFWLGNNASVLSTRSARGRSHILSACVPGDALVASHVVRLLRKLPRGATDTPTLMGGGGASSSVNGDAPPLAVVATNSPSALRALRMGVAAVLPSAKVVAFRDWLDALREVGNSNDNGGSSDRRGPSSPLLTWPAGLFHSTTENAAPFTATDASLMDTVLLSLAAPVVLNRYSTFSQSAIDFRVLRGDDVVPSSSGRSSAGGAGPRGIDPGVVYWW